MESLILGRRQRLKVGLVAMCFGVAFLAALACVQGQQLPTASIQVLQATTTPVAISSPELDDLARKLAAEINNHKMTSIVVAGGNIPGERINEFGVQLRDALSEELARQTAGVRFMDSASLSALLKPNRISEGVIYVDDMGFWIGAHAHVEGAIALSVDKIKDGKADLTAKLYDERTPLLVDNKKKTYISAASLTCSIVLSETEAKATKQAYKPPLSIPAGMAGEKGVGTPTCSFCPHPSYSELGKRRKINGTIYMEATVRPDGQGDDIFIVVPLGYGLDSKVVEAILSWKFQPAKDSHGQLMPARVPIEVIMQLF